MKPATATIDDLRRSYGDLLRRVQPGGERIIITRRGRPIAALVPTADLDRLEEPMSEEQREYTVSPDRAKGQDALRLQAFALAMTHEDRVKAAQLLAQAAADLLKAEQP